MWLLQPAVPSEGQQSFRHVRTQQTTTYTLEKLLERPLEKPLESP